MKLEKITELFKKKKTHFKKKEKKKKTKKLTWLAIEQWTEWQRQVGSKDKAVPATGR